METKIKGHIKTKKKMEHFSFGRLMLLVYSCVFILIGCLKEEVNTNRPKSGPEQFQLHNFNAPLSGGSLEGSAPDIHYFRQKEDGSYVFMLTSVQYDGFETKWATDYVLVITDSRGIIQKSDVIKFPVKEGIRGNFTYAFGYGTPPPESPLALEEFYFRTAAISPNYVADDKSVIYYTPDNKCGCRNLFFNLHPETGQSEYVTTGPSTPLPQIFRTSDEGFITIGGADAPDYHKFSASGTLEFKQPMKYWEARPAYVYLTGRNGDQYLIATYSGPPVQWFADNKAKSFLYYASLYINMPPTINELEVRFGPGKTQKAHRFNRAFCYGFDCFEYQDYVDVPFEIWDITNNQQLMASFRDQAEDGVFNPVHMNIDLEGFPCCGKFRNDPDQSQEWITILGEPYSTTPMGILIALGPFAVPALNITTYLTAGATWNPSSLPSSIFSLKVGPRPGTQILKVNANGSSVVKDNYTLGTVPLQNMFKAVPYLDGSAVLINIRTSTVANPTTQLAILDADFNQKTVLNMISNTADQSHQLEYNKEKDRVFYARLTSNPEVNTDNAYKGSILLSVIRDNVIKTEKYLDEFIPFKLEKYRIAPTKTGGVAIVAWVRPTKDTRDLLFLELDENLELMKR